MDKKATIASNSSPVKAARNVRRDVERELYVRAGGRCEFDGCNKCLLENPLTLTRGNYGEKSHIYAFRETGPRGSDPGRPDDINAVSNLILLCATCHKEIDDHPDRYSRDVLVSYKRAHEDRIHFVTGFGPDRKTALVQFKAKIGGKDVAIPAADIFRAVAPSFPSDPHGTIIDLSLLNDRLPNFMETAKATIDEAIRPLVAPRLQGLVPQHISVFALGPIPLLVYLGSRLSDKLAVDFYQFHRDTKDWSWKTSGEPVAYTLRMVRSGTAPDRVALLLSLSGQIHPEKLPSEIDETFSIYDLTLLGKTPDPTFLNTMNDLMGFRRAYLACIAVITKDHPGIPTIHFFPACPAPVAVLCGHDLLNKVHPALRVFDFDKTNGGFSYQLTVNEP